MANAEETDFFDIYKLDLQLREKINDLHWKTESLDEAQRELAETRRALYETQTLLDDERRSSSQLKMQLNSAVEAVRRMEDDKIKSEAHNVRLKMNCETAEMERDILISEARMAKLQNMELKIKQQELEANFATSKMINETLEASLIELKNSATRLHTAMHGNVGKLKREQEQLKQSLTSSMQFGQRMQQSLKTAHIARQRDKKRIEELQKRIDALNAREASAPAVVMGDDTDIGTLHLKMESTLQELRRKLENNAIDEKLSLICNEFRKLDGRLVTD